MLELHTMNCLPRTLLQWHASRLLQAVLCCLFALSPFAVCGAAAPAKDHAMIGCGDLVHLALPHAVVNASAFHLVGTSAVCQIEVTSRPSSDSDIRIEVWIPAGKAWNGKFVQVGSGGYGGQILDSEIVPALARGFAVAATDDGHESESLGSADWALGHPEKLTDFGWRAVKDATEVAKALIVANKGILPKLSYFDGCSDGGREGLMEVQRYPLDFDGVVAGAPGNYMARLMTMRAAYYSVILQPGGYLDLPQLKLIQNAALLACGGVEDGYIHDPESCHFDPASLLCKREQTAACLTPPQLASIQAIYAGWHDPRTGKLLSPGLEPGVEAQPAWRFTIFGVSAATLRTTAPGFVLADGYLKDFAFNDATFDLAKLDLGTQASAAVDKTAPILDAEQTDLSAFKKHGGKLLQYHGWADPNISPLGSVQYFREVQERMGDTSDFYRLFMVPGMLHCSGGRGPDRVDWLGALDDWVSSGKAPHTLTAVSTAGDGPQKQESTRTQTLCPYPSRAARPTTQGSPTDRDRCEEPQ